MHFAVVLRFVESEIRRKHRTLHKSRKSRRKKQEGNKKVESETKNDEKPGGRHVGSGENHPSRRSGRERSRAERKLLSLRSRSNLDHSYHETQNRSQSRSRSNLDQIRIVVKHATRGNTRVARGPTGSGPKWLGTQRLGTQNARDPKRSGPKRPGTQVSRDP